MGRNYPLFSSGQIKPPEWTPGQEVTGFNGQLEVYLNKFQDPTQSDAMSRVQSDLDETKIVLVSDGNGDNDCI